MIKCLGYISDQLYEVELVRSEIQHKEPTFVGFFVQQNGKFRMLELYYNSFGNYFQSILSLMS